MRSTERRRRAQRGVSLVEAVVASALLGFGVVAGVTAWDTATISAGKAVRQAWARCMVRSELDAIAAAPWDNLAGYPSPDTHVIVSVATVPGRTGEERVTVVARDPQTEMLLYQASALKPQVLSGSSAKDMTGNGVLTDVASGCPAP